MTKKTTKKTAKKSPYKFKNGDKAIVVNGNGYFKDGERVVVIENNVKAPWCRNAFGEKWAVDQSRLKLVSPPRTVLTIKTSKGCAKIIKTESGFHVQSKSGNNEIVQHSESLVAKQNAIENILATFEIYNSAEMRAWAKEEKRKMKGGAKK